MTILVEQISSGKVCKSFNGNPERAGERPDEARHSTTSRDYQDKTNFRTSEWKDKQLLEYSGDSAMFN